MTNASLVINRRFIRIQAVQRLYAFYVCKQANHDWALDQIRGDFIPDVFADPLVDEVQLAQAMEQSLVLLNLP